MRKQTDQRKPTRRSRNGSDPLQDWRRRLRPQILSELVEQSNDLPWSSRLITLLLSELHAGDEFYDLVDSAEQPATQTVPTAHSHRSAPPSQLVSGGPGRHRSVAWADIHSPH